MLITHGSHSNIDEKLRFDTGFTYLVENLTENGIKMNGVDFLNMVIHNKIEGTTYEVNTPCANKIYGFDVMNRIGYKEDKIITDISNKGLFTVERTTIKDTTDSWFFQKDKIIIYTITFGQGKYQTKSLLNIKWKNKTHKLSFVPTTKDFSG